MNRNNTKISFFDILLMINLLSAIQIPCLGQYIPHISIIYSLLNIISFVVIVLNLKKVNIGNFFVFASIYYIALLIPTIINNSNILGVIREMICNLTTILILNSLSKEQFKEKLNKLVLVLEILTFLNLIIILISPEGLYNIGYARKYFLFDHVNIAIRYLLPGCCLEMIRSYLESNKIDKRCAFYLSSVILTLILTTPVTGIIGFIAFILAFLLTKKVNLIRKIIQPFNSVLGAGTVSFLIIVVKIQIYFSSFIENVLHKDITFTGRTEIWQRTIDLISNNFLIGYGRLSIEDRINILNASSPHNQFLVIMFEGGILLLILTFIGMFYITKKLKKCRNKEISAILLSTIFSYSIMWITEPFSYTGTTLMLIVWLLAYRSYKLFKPKQI